MEKKFIFVTGGVVSGLGKGITAASIGRILKSKGIKVTMQKLDPYLNVDPGTMNPTQHGEVFVTDDGLECDLDLGHYERFICENLNKFSNMTSGKIYSNVINKEREGYYLGKTVQVIPHITDEIKESIYNALSLSNADVIITEIGGTVGDIESQPFIETIRQIKSEHKDNVLFVHVTLIPYLEMSGELKTKPTQHSCKELMSLGIIPNIIVARTSHLLDEELKEKIGLFCNLNKECVIENMDASSIYDVPMLFEEQNISNIIKDKLKLKYTKDELNIWYNNVNKKDYKKTITIGIVGKYISLKDAYMSIYESLNHAASKNETNIEIKWIDSEKLENLDQLDGIVVPGGFGNRGIEGKIKAITYARENNIPLLGICLGMQLMVIEFIRNVCGIKDANSQEFTPNNNNNVIHLMEEQKNITNKGGTMRLGAYPCVLKENSKVKDIYKESKIAERHRHRFEFNNEYREIVIKNGMNIVGTSPDDMLVEVVELKEHPFMIGVQYHPELKSRPDNVHPLFDGLIKNCLENK